MTNQPLPPMTGSEEERLAALAALDIIDGPRDPVLDRLTHLVKIEFGVPFSAIFLIDRHRGVLKSRQGLTTRELPRDQTFCTHTVESGEPVLIADTRLDPRTRTNPAVIGAPFLRSYAGVPLKTRDGISIGALCTFDVVPRDIAGTRLRVLREFSRLAMECIELRRLATQDQLTGALNRRGFTAALHADIRRSRRTGAPLSLAMMDLDHFKQINDRHGHAAGDVVLSGVAELIRERSEIEAFGRLGGEEFALLLPDFDLPAAHDLIETLRRQVAQLRFPGLPDQGVTASFGLARLGAGDTLPDRASQSVKAEAAAAGLLDRADRALYRAKSLGRNLVVGALAGTGTTAA